jgi:class 3 adenylate cyclase/tetratricopeptide (TPR) repeat protein
VVCDRCGAESDDGSRFCSSCGAPLGARCSSCGAALASDARFCGRCGSPVAVASDVVAGEERKLVTVLFADIEGSTALGERLDPEPLQQVMNRYFDAMRAEILAQGGTVEKFIGDAVMAVFGAPTAHEDDPTRAVRAALRMRDRLDALNEALERDHGVALRMRIGVNTGEVLAVMPLSAERGLVTGDAVNVAARLEQAARPGSILVADRTARAATGVRFEDAGRIEIRGRREPLRVFVATGPGSVPTAANRPPTAPIVGRERELELLLSILARATDDGQPYLVTIYGEAGVGKTRLVEEFVARASASSNRPTVVRGRCLPYGDGVTYWPLVEILKRAARILDGDPPDEALAKLRAHVQALAGRAGPSGSLEPGRPGPERPDAEALAVTIGLGTAAPAEADPRETHRRTSAAWRAYLAALASSAPLVVVVEDLHWADAALLDLLERLVDRVRRPVLFVCAARPELTTKRPSWGGGGWNASSLLLPPLGEGDSAELLDLLVSAQGQRLPDATQRDVLSRAGGNPFFLEELVRLVADERREAAEAPGEMPLPDSVQALLAARLDMLPPLEKRVAQAAAVVGREFWAAPLADVLSLPRRDIERALDVLEERGIVQTLGESSVADERAFAFRHILARDVAYETLPRRERGRAHAAVAGWLERLAAGRDREFAELLAHHYGLGYRFTAEDRARRAEAAPLRELAFRYALLASIEARGKLALGAAAAQAQDALAIAVGDEERGALEALGEASLLEGDGDHAWALLRRAADLAIGDETLDPIVVARVCIRALEVCTRTRGTLRSKPSVRDVEPYLRAAEERVAGREGEELVRLLVVRALRTAFAEPPTDAEALEAREAGERAAAIARSLARPDLQSLALDGVGDFYISRGLYGAWRPVVAERLGLVDSLSDPFEVGDVYSSAAWCAYHAGRYREAERYAELGLAATTGVESLNPVFCLDWRVTARARLGAWDEALEDASEIARILGDRAGRPPGFAADHVGAVALIREARGDVRGADAMLEIADWVDRAEERPSPGLASWVAMVEARRGRFREGLERLSRPALLGQDYGVGLLLEARCDLTGDAGAWDDAAAVVAEARKRAELGLDALRAHADRLEGRALVAAGRADAAVELLDRARSAFESLEAAWAAALCGLDAAEAVRGGGEARVRLEAALPVLERLGDVAALDRARGLGERLG